MNTAPTRSTLVAKAQMLLKAHHGPAALVLPNVWDVGSARMVADARFPVIATSSRAIAATLGLRDDDSSDPDVIFDVVSRIARSVDCPVTADLESGYGLKPEELVERILEAGVVGCNLEDTDHHGDGVLVDPGRQAEFLANVRSAATDAGVHIVVNARVDSVIRHVGDERYELADAIRRGLLYLEAGADCIYPIALGDRDRIARLTAAIPGPVNITARQGGLAFSELTALGVRRISFASGLFSFVQDRLHRAVRRIAESDDPNALWQDLPADAN